MDYQIIVFLTNRAIQAVDITDGLVCEKICFDEQECFYYEKPEEFVEFRNALCRFFNVDGLGQMDARATIVSCGAEIGNSIALQQQMQELKELDVTDIRKLLPIVLENKGLLKTDNRTVLKILDQYFLVKVNEKGIAETIRNKVAKEAIELNGDDFSFLYFYKVKDGILSEEERWKHQQELAKVQREAEKLIVEAQEQAQHEIATMQHEYAHMIEDYERCKKIVEDLEAEKRRKAEKFASLGMGDIVKFGKYYQDNTGTKKDIEWQVLDVEEKRVLLISKYGLDAVQFHPNGNTNKWASCNLRSWLNDVFFKTAFSVEEAKQIATTNVETSVSDKLFLLSVAEVNKYFTSDNVRKCKVTDYAKANGASPAWWLRSAVNNSNNAAYVRIVGSVNITGYIVSDTGICVRPALWVNL